MKYSKINKKTNKNTEIQQTQADSFKKNPIIKSFSSDNTDHEKKTTQY